MSDQSLLTIEVFRREGSGKSYNRKLRARGRIPAVLLDKGKATSLEFDPKNLAKAWTGGRKFNMQLDGSSRVVKIIELQLDPVKRFALHVDLVYE